MPNESFEVSVFLNEETELTFVNKQESSSEVIEVIDVDQIPNDMFYKYNTSKSCFWILIWFGECLYLTWFDGNNLP